MFESKNTMKKYFDHIKYMFELEYPQYEVGIKIDTVPTFIDDTMYGRVILYYYYKDFYQNTNIFFVA